MLRRLLPLTILSILVTSVAFADLPTYPGAKPFGPAQNQPTNMKVDMPGMPAGISGMNSSSKSQTYTLPATATFEEIKKFYSAELTKLGYAEQAQVKITGMAMPTQTASFAKGNGMDTVSLTLTKNPTNATENLLSISESATSLH